MKTLHITVHLGDGAGKAAAGLAVSDDIIVLLEHPQKTYWKSKAEQKGVRVIIKPDNGYLKSLIEESDIVIINWWGHPLMACFLAEFPEIPCRLVLYCHVNGCDYPYLPYSFLDAFDAVMFTTPYSYENPFWTEAERYAIQKKSAVVYGMGDFKPSECLPRNSYRLKDVFEIGYIGTLNYAKMNPAFVHYCEAAAAKVKNIRFVLAGDLSIEVKKDIEQSSIADRFTYAGYVTRSEDFYRRVDVLGYLLNTHAYATTENVLLEAMAYAVPIVALNQGVERHILKNGYSAYLADDMAGYADAVCQLYDSEKKRKELGMQARRDCMETYDSDENKKKYRQAVQKCLAGHKQLHRIGVLQGRTPFEWFLLFSRTAAESLERYTQHIYLQQSKGSLFQYSSYFPEDVQLKNICRQLEEVRKNDEFKNR